MHRLMIVVLSLTGLALLVVAAGSVAPSSAKAPWKILLTSNREGDSEIYSMNPDGSHAKRLTHAPGVDGAGPRHQMEEDPLLPQPGRSLGDERRRERQAEPHPEPRIQLAGLLVSRRAEDHLHDNRDGNNEIYVMDADGSAQRNLAPAPSSQEFAGSWSPDGRTILFTTNRDGNWELYSMDAAGRNAHNLTRNRLNDGRDGGFVWSPDGNKIAFGTNRDKNLELYVANADGGGLRRLARTRDEFVFAWSPDGRRLAFGRFPVNPGGRSSS